MTDLAAVVQMQTPAEMVQTPVEVFEADSIQKTNEVVETPAQAITADSPQPKQLREEYECGGLPYFFNEFWHRGKCYRLVAKEKETKNGFVRHEHAGYNFIEITKDKQIDGQTAIELESAEG